MPPNGLVIYCGTIVTDEGKEKKVNIDFEPFKPINTSLYLCDNKVGVVIQNCNICALVCAREKLQEVPPSQVQCQSCFSMYVIG